MKKAAFLLCGLVLTGLVAYFLLASVPKAENEQETVPVAKVADGSGQTVEQSCGCSETVPGKDGAKGMSADSAEKADDERPLTADEKSEAAAEAKVEAFDNLTDKWMEPSKQGVSMKDIDDFKASFRAVPKDRKDECIHRALNLIPDENVMLLAGVLMDKTEEKEIVETVFNDVLNRDEDVKKPILKQIFADKTHPCWADTAWILDVTGELPAKK